MSLSPAAAERQGFTSGLIVGLIAGLLVALVLFGLQIVLVPR